MKYPAHVKYDNIGTVTYIKIRTKELGDIVSGSENPLSFVKKTLLHYYKINSKWLTPIETKHCNLTARINILKTDLEKLEVTKDE